ncbi:MAG TPA: hypothetical protein VFH82_04150 [Gemmatimonadota bacterium]|jgi:hypothetical protein|nr:hypothetical protein [Gemmatimonadota bacterium]
MRPIAPIAPILLLTAAFAAACAGNPEPGESGYPYNLTGRYQVDVVAEGTPYRGTVDLSTAPGGAVSGSFTITEPTEIVGSVEGAIVADTLDFQMPYEILANNCAGVVHGRGAIVEGGTGMSSAVRIDGCDGQLNATMTLTR